MRRMARGFESKNVEEQQRAVTDNVSDKRSLDAAEAHKKRRVQELTLQRERILSERTSSPHRRSALEIALADIEEKLAELGWTIHM